MSELENWGTLNEWVMQADEKAVKGALEKERKGKRRAQFLLRLHQRYNVLRANRERAQLFGE